LKTPRFFQETIIMRKQTAWITALAAAALMTLASCSGSQPLSTREEGTLGGAGLGGVGGALVGAAVGHPAAGALIGAGLGGVGGYAVGNEMQNNENANMQTQQQVQSQQQQIEQQRRQIQQMQTNQETE
jgi:osmotically inducible lipoprotein OsmB